MADDDEDLMENEDTPPAGGGDAGGDAGGDMGEDDMAAAMAEEAGGEVEFESLEGSSSSDLEGGEGEVRTAHDLEPVFDVPVNVQAVLGKSHLEVSQLLKLGPGAVIELDRKVGEAIDIYVNDRLVARGEVVLIDEHLGITMTEIIKGDRI